MAKALYNPKEGSDIKEFVWSHGRWDLKVNEVKKFPDDVAEAMMRHFEFLVEVTPKNIADIKKAQESKQLKCPQCDFETNHKVALAGHLKSHGVSEETKGFLSEIEEAKPKGSYEKPKEVVLTPEQIEGIPQSGQTDKDGVDWYGEGLETDNPKVNK